MQLLMSFNQHRRLIFALLLLALLMAMVFMPAFVVEAGRAISNGG